jgi:ubiquinone/menaquinone biosynthesis C-methylase UbiE
MAKRKSGRAPFPVTLLNQGAEQIPLDAGSVDTVVTTCVLCSLAKDGAVLREMKRVLKSDGRLIFLEHGLSPEPNVQAWQRRLTPLWKPIAGGCRLDKRIDELIGRSGFGITEMENCYLPGPQAMTYFYRGFAVPD